ncbi:Asp-tRNA(Asn)/Glu-tRNA(Gln) amidotransferase subunit GatB [Alphaproteobacteria bacterium]|nr:Asp-tRNA(Asn)/Glu-tRNA(Gln) amidotransferase subunit GatB [Alphaproteobacteria bacterium]
MTDKVLSDWELVIGLEVHAQISSKAKLFSGSGTNFGAPPNTLVSFVDAAMPGMLPVINEYCIEQAVKTGLGLKAKINNYSIFDRKNYFYADLPAGYQISQFEDPIVGKGEVILDMPDGSTRKVGITRLHLEQDAGKSIHDQDPNNSFVDLNRSGIALMEIVSEPDLRSSEEAAIYLRKLRTILRYLGTCDGNMEQGSMRADVNVSIRKYGANLGTRCEIKNVNSIRYVQQAIDFESKRQILEIESGKKIDQETRLFDSRKGETRSMRSKEESHDYRYFPDPDLLPLRLEEKWVQKIQDTLPELPDIKKKRFVQDYGLSNYDAGILITDRETANYFEEVARNRNAKIAANWVSGELFAYLNKVGISISNSPITAEDLGELIDLITSDTISGRIAKEVFEVMLESGESPKKIVEDRGLQQLTDTKQLEEIIDNVLKSNFEKVSEYKNGKEKLFGFFVGQVMKQSSGKANPKIVNEFLTKKLNN